MPYTDGSGVTGTTVSVKRLGKNSLQETYYRDGKKMSTVAMTVATDGQTIKATSHSLQAGRTMTSVANKQ